MVDPGTLYIVATPIGSARDITLRALDILGAVDVIAAEDTRKTRRLLDLHAISLAGRPLIAYHDHNGPSVRPRIIEHLKAGRSVAYVSDAGTPLVADPGFALVRETLAADQAVTSAPGPSAVLTALSIAGLPTDKFLFAGFAPPKSEQRKRFLAEISDVPATLVFFETAKRSSAMLKDCLAIFGDRSAALCRELTKKYEEVARGSISSLIERSEAGLKGEVVVLIDRNRAEATPEDMESHLREALKTMRVKDAAAEVSQKLGLPRRDVYQAALALQNDIS